MHSKLYPSAEQLMMQERIYEMLQSANKENIDLALMIAKGQDMWEYLLEIHEPTFNFLIKHNKIDKYLTVEQRFYATYQLTKLDLRYNNLGRFPTEISRLKNLETLSLGVNNISQLSDEIGELVNLKKLNLMYNSLTSLPESIGNLRNLKELYISNNELLDLPESFGQLKSLFRLDAIYNKFRTFPEGISNLTNIQELFLYRNNIQSLPDWLGKLQKLKHLSLSGNPIYSYQKKDYINELIPSIRLIE